MPQCFESVNVRLVYLGRIASLPGERPVPGAVPASGLLGPPVDEEDRKSVVLGKCVDVGGGRFV